MKTNFVKYLTDEEVKQILEYVRNLKSPSMSSLIITMVYTGQRVGDICSLRVDNFSNCFTKLNFVMQKTKKPIELPIPKVLSNHLLQYYAKYHDQMKDGYLFFPGVQGHNKHPHIIKHSVGAQFSKMRKALGFDTPYYSYIRKDGKQVNLYRVSSHSLRHFAAHKILIATKDPVLTCEWFKWTKMDMVLRYARTVHLIEESANIAEEAYNF